jgi:DNA-binding MarR family transcriptional regulator
MNGAPLEGTASTDRAAPEPLAYLLQRLVMTVRGQMRAALAPFELSLSQYVCLSTVAAIPHQSNAELARELGVSPQATNVVLRRLQHAGLVTRLTGGHGRSQPVMLTAIGRATLRDADAALRAVDDHRTGTAADSRHIGLQTVLRALPLSTRYAEIPAPSDRRR